VKITCLGLNRIYTLLSLYLLLLLEIEHLQKSSNLNTCTPLYFLSVFCGILWKLVILQNQPVRNGLVITYSCLECRGLIRYFKLTRLITYLSSFHSDWNG
uniref:Uncharacterized protein n=1 Tax=Chrysemys picta bellii TaxID=8478 RepID=A0A8C3HJE7_CHRPI